MQFSRLTLLNKLIQVDFNIHKEAIQIIALKIIGIIYAADIVIISVVRLRLPIPDPTLIYSCNVNTGVCIGGVGFFELLRILVVFVIGRNVVGPYVPSL